MRATRLFTIAAAVFCASTLPASLGARQAAQSQPIRVGTNFVRVDAYPMLNGAVVGDLQRGEFEVLEDGVAQRIETFEHVVPIHGPQTARPEAASQREMAAQVGNPRNRLFVFFLDGTHVAELDSRAINQPLIDFLRTQLADDDLVAIMTPDMSTANLTFARKTLVLEESLRATWDWGRRDRSDPALDAREIQYGLCYPGPLAMDVVAKMSARRRERATLEALHDLVRYLASLRDERKAIVTVTQGWPIFRPDPDLMRMRKAEAPVGIDTITVGRNGQPTTHNDRNSVNALPKTDCDEDRLRLSQIDDDQYLKDLIDEANRGNSSFYMIDPGGLRASFAADRSTAMRVLADNTDGFAALNSNDLNRGLRRAADDLSSYYLLGYYSTNSKPDGKYHSITVKVNRPGVQVRARKGYRSPSAAETAALRNTPVNTTKASPEANEVANAIGSLGRIRPDARLCVQAVSLAGPRPKLWVSGELPSSSGKPDDFALGANVAIVTSGGGGSKTANVVMKPGERTFSTTIDVPAGMDPVDVHVRVAPVDSPAAPLFDGVQVPLSTSPSKALVYKRGVTTGNKLMPAADVRLSRSDRVRLEIPVGPSPRDGTAGTGRLLDRAGQPLQVPVTVAERTDEASGQRWVIADVSLAPLSAGDYAIEVVVQTELEPIRLLTAIRVVR